MEAFDHATLNRFVESMSPPDVQDNENRILYTEFAHGDDIDSGVNKKEYEYIPPIPQTKVSLTSSNDGDYDSNEATPQPQKQDKTLNNANVPYTNNDIHDDPTELTAMREKLQALVSEEVEVRGMNISIPPQNEQPKYGDDPKENHLISLINQQSLKEVIQTITHTPTAHVANVPHVVSHNAHKASPIIHPAVQKLYEQQQQLLEKLQLLEKDDPDPLWHIMQRIFTEENAAERQRNIEDLTNTLDKKHRQVTNAKDGVEVNEKTLLRSIHEMSKETKNELKEMRQQLDEERKINNELRHKIRTKNRQLNTLSKEKNDEKYNYNMPPMAYDPNSVKRRDLEPVDSNYSLNEDKPSAFSNWCINMGFQQPNKKCSWF